MLGLVHKKFNIKALTQILKFMNRTNESLVRAEMTHTQTIGSETTGRHRVSAKKWDKT